jgi:hypothetical protein
VGHRGGEVVEEEVPARFDQVLVKAGVGVVEGVCLAGAYGVVHGEGGGGHQRPCVPVVRAGCETDCEHLDDPAQCA